ncbi:hypothetical protein CLV62_11099 [Dysgonomonas alginatilytica]|uniref:Uncharacterized protein n=1 Tax=Dysgonomonas alginatilytica TaxID=1605892 RepID=A0A2V3PWB5_9BACT|nr:hypothetical protein CLV62_11099 [Dysgonomonas alginatilytica]
MLYFCCNEIKNQIEMKLFTNIISTIILLWENLRVSSAA